MTFGRIAQRTGLSYPVLRSLGRNHLPPLSERRFQQQVLDLAHLHRWKTYHTWNSMHSTGGFPDLVLVKGERLIFAELKSNSPRARLSDTQLEWLEALSHTSAEVHVWRPSDWTDIVRTLR